MHQVFRAFAFPVRDVQRALRQPGVALQEHLLRRLVPVARNPIRDSWLKARKRHLLQGCLSGALYDTNKYEWVKRLIRGATGNHSTQSKRARHDQFHDLLEMLRRLVRRRKGRAQ
jgi:hypothetical protein